MKRSIGSPALVISVAVLLLSQFPGTVLARQLGTVAKRPIPIGLASPLPASGQPFMAPRRRLYLATDQKGQLAKWVGGAEWTHATGDGTLYNHGTNPDSLIIAPYHAPRDDYEVETEIFVGLAQCPAGFGIFVRWSHNQGPYSSTDCNGHVGIWAGPLDGAKQEAQVNYLMTTDWHIYRLEVQGTSLNFYVDGHFLVTATDEDLQKYHGGEVGLWTHGDQIYVHRFEVCAGTGYPCDLTVK